MTQHFLRHFPKNRNTDIGTDNGAESAAGAFIIGVNEQSRAITFTVEIFP